MRPLRHARSAPEPSASCISLSTYGGDASSTVFTRHSTEARELVPSASPLVLATSGRERGYACSRRHSAQPSESHPPGSTPYPSSDASITLVWHIRTKGAVQGTYVR